MATSWSQADIAALEAAMKYGALEVQFENQRVRFQSLAEMLKLRREMADAIAAAAGTSASRTTYGSVSKGETSSERF